MVIKRRRFKQTHSLEGRLTGDTEQLIERAKVLPNGPDRSDTVRKIKQNMAALQICEMLRLPKIQSTK